MLESIKHYDDSTNLRLFPREKPKVTRIEKYLWGYLQHSKERYPELSLLLENFLKLEPETFKHSVSVAIVAENAYNRLANGKDSKGAESVRIAGLLHDIGKTAIDPHGVEASTHALHPENGSGRGITPKEKDIIITHDLLGVFMVKSILNNVTSIPKDIAEKAVMLTGNHHRNMGEPLSAEDQYKVILFTLCDIAVTMREKRSFAPEARKLSIKSLFEWAKLTFLKQNIDLNTFKKEEVEHMAQVIIDATFAIDGILQQPPTNLDNRVGNSGNLLPDLHKVAWGIVHV